MVDLKITPNNHKMQSLCIYIIINPWCIFAAYIDIRFTRPDIAVHIIKFNIENNPKGICTNKLKIGYFCLHVVTVRLHLHAQYKSVCVYVHDVVGYYGQYGNATYQYH